MLVGLGDGAVVHSDGKRVSAQLSILYILFNRVVGVFLVDFKLGNGAAKRDGETNTHTQRERGRER